MVDLRRGRLLLGLGAACLLGEYFDSLLDMSTTRKKKISNNRFLYVALAGSTVRN